MTTTEIKTRIRELKEELENRFKYGTFKISSPTGAPVSTEKLQNELYNLIYKISKIES